MKADFDIGNLVYIILTIAFLIFGALGKKKKPIRKIVEEEEAPDTSYNSENIKAQFQELFSEFNPGAELIKAQEYQFTQEHTVEDGPILDEVPEMSYESIEDIIPPAGQAIDSNINYNDQAQSSLDTTGMEEGIPAFDYEKDHNSLIFNDITKEYSSVMTESEEELAGLVDEFDPKTAFIYSEIFKRKDF